MPRQQLLVFSGIGGLLGLVRFGSRDDSLRFGYMVNTSPTWDAARCLPAREWVGPTEFSRIFLTSPAV